MLKSAAGLRQVRVLCACCLIMTFVDLDHNDELLAALRKKEKFEWVTPRLTLMEAEDTDAKEYKYPNENGVQQGPS